jgi:TPR repeat protein
MSQPSTGPAGWRAALARPRLLLLGGLAASVGAAALVAVVTIDAPLLSTRQAGKVSIGISEGAPAFGRDDAAQPAKPAPAVAATESGKPADAANAAPANTTPAKTPPPGSTPADTATANASLAALPIEEVRKRAEAYDLPAMVEIGGRLITGTGIAKDPAGGAGWMLHAAERGSAQAAFNVGVMYETGFVVERDSTKAAYWYRRASDAGLATAQNNLALLLRVGKGVPRDGAQAVELLHAAARQGMTAAMFTLGDIYEKGDVAPKDPVTALAWFAITLQFESDAHKDERTALAKAAVQRSQALERVLTPADLHRAGEMGQREIQAIDQTMHPPPPGPMPAPALPPPAPSTQAAIDWPAATVDQVRAVQQALFDLKLLQEKPSGAYGPNTRAAIRDFQHRNGLAETGEPTRDLYEALQRATAKQKASPPPRTPTGPKASP